ncbi:hypothetical protein [Bacteroides rodentium]|uniref:hypothetical protein n=1 Tax=Bacteroides rodentium TaxID=691816 RepID=UPI00131ED3EC|nr:hypothetical protein [Bacteroides rodentium]
MTNRSGVRLSCCSTTGPTDMSLGFPGKNSLRLAGDCRHCKLLHSFCSGAAKALQWDCKGDAVTLQRCCSETAKVMQQFCRIFAATLQKACSGANKGIGRSNKRHVGYKESRMPPWERDILHSHLVHPWVTDGRGR